MKDLQNLIFCYIVIKKRRLKGLINILNKQRNILWENIV